MKREIVKIINLETSAIEHCNVEKMKKYNDMIINQNEIYLPNSTVTLRSGTQLDSTEWAIKLMEDPKNFIFFNDTTSDEDKIVNKLVQ